MNSKLSKLNQRVQLDQEQRQTHFQSQETQTAVREFHTVDDLLRYDSEQNPIPAEVGERLGNSIQAEPTEARRPWYRRIFG